MTLPKRADFEQEETDKTEKTYPAANGSTKGERWA
jgi:hypothetical protein